MGYPGKPMFDLNEYPKDNDGEFMNVGAQPQKSLPAFNGFSSATLEASAGPTSVGKTNAFSDKSAISGFQTFVRTKISPSLENNDNMMKLVGGGSNLPLFPKVSSNERNLISVVDLGSKCPSAVDREEGERSDGVPGSIGSRHAMQCKALKELEIAGPKDQSAFDFPDKKSSFTDSVTEIDRNETSISCAGLVTHVYDVGGSGGNNSEANTSVDGQRGPDPVPKTVEVKGTEVIHANSIGKKHKLDEQKEAMHGKKRNRQTMFLNLEDVKQVGAAKASTPRRQNIPPSISHTMRGSRSVPSPAEPNGDKQNDMKIKDRNQDDLSCKEEAKSVEPNDCTSECNSDLSVALLTKTKRLNSSSDLSVEGNNGARQNLLNQPAESFQAKNARLPYRKPGLVSHGSVGLNSAGNTKNPSSQYQDTSVERLIREVTSGKFWHNSENTEFQCVPGQFMSVEEYVGVFESLLFQECRAQLFSTWEELTEPSSKDVPAAVRVKGVEKRERGWFDVIVVPVNETKWMFKEGDVAVLSSSKPVRTRRNTSSSAAENKETETNERVIGTIRRHIPIDTRDPIDAILHFYLGESYDSNSDHNHHILRKLQPDKVYFLTTLGSLATSQREYVALHAFCHLNSQMQTAILQPSPKHFPKYEEQTPTMPECFTSNFVEYLNRKFNSSQLAAIQWAATHTAAGTNNGTAKRQDPWPFTLVQGPPGTGKTHTVWGMLNVIHLVQYQHYYNALLKNLSPDSYKKENENTVKAVSGSIDEVLQNMDQNLFRTLPKLCPKPRMLVCAPSNSATDELLARVLERGFIDGEMKVYRPDVARVGVDSQSRAAQAVSVERRTEKLLVKTRDEVNGLLQQLKGREIHLSHQIASLQRLLVVAAAAGRSQGSIGVDPYIPMSRDQNRDALLQNLAAAVEGRDKVLVKMSRVLILEGRYRHGSGFNLEEARASLEASFANEAEVVFTTLSSSGCKLFSHLTHGFDMVVIDEAAQASEMAVLPPLNLGAARCVLVGDPQQLPATVISKAAGTLQYSRSLFERLQLAGCPSMLLSVQYRMHPHIRDFPSRHFYQGRLTDSESVVNLPDEKYHQDTLLRPYIFFDIGRESHEGGLVSCQNVHEAQFCLCLYKHLQKTVKSLGLGKVTVGIITPYKLQLRCLKLEFQEVLSSEEGRDVYINTVDAFQGQERDVIIMSCVRAGHGVGFVADIRGMNVALTRARRALWVIGNANSLVHSDDWGALIADAKGRNCFMDMNSLPKDFQIPKGPSYAAFPGPFRGPFRAPFPGPFRAPFPGPFRAPFPGPFARPFPGPFARPFPGLFPGPFARPFRGPFPGPLRGPFPGPFTHGARGMIRSSGGPRPILLGMPLEFNPVSSSGRGLTERSENNRFTRPPHFQNSANGLDHFGDRSRDSRPLGAQKRQDSSGLTEKRES